MQNADLVGLTAMLVALQFAAFGWRIVREIQVGDERRKVWLPVTDVVNLLSMASVVFFAVIFPLANGYYSSLSKTFLAVGFVLIAFHPLSMAGHYCLFSEHGRATYKKPNGDWRCFPPPEILFVSVSLVASAVVGYYVAISIHGVSSRPCNIW